MGDTPDPFPDISTARGFLGRSLHLRGKPPKDTLLFGSLYFERVLSEGVEILLLEVSLRVLLNTKKKVFILKNFPERLNHPWKPTHK